MRSLMATTVMCLPAKERSRLVPELVPFHQPGLKTLGTPSGGAEGGRGTLVQRLGVSTMPGSSWPTSRTCRSSSASSSRDPKISPPGRRCRDWCFPEWTANIAPARCPLLCPYYYVIYLHTAVSGEQGLRLLHGPDPKTSTTGNHNVQSDSRGGTRRGINKFGCGICLSGEGGPT